MFESMTSSCAWLTFLSRRPRRNKHVVIERSDFLRPWTAVASAVAGGRVTRTLPLSLACMLNGSLDGSGRPIGENTAFGSS
jgi:hypothetical protein